MTSAAALATPAPVEPTRPVLRWHGGKWRLAPWIIGHFPKRRVYVEPFGGAGCVLLRKPRDYAEVYNDLDNQVVNLFTILRAPGAAAHLIEMLRLTPFARAEFDLAYEAADAPIEEARRLIIRSFMGFGSNGVNSEWRTGFRANSNRSGTTPARDWVNYPDALVAIVERLRGVIVENRPAVQVIAAHDGPQTLHYVDPPYLHATRSRKIRRKSNNGLAAYRHEMSDADHVALLEYLREEVRGMVVLSGYPSQIYDQALSDWKRVERRAMADGARPTRTEVLWINPAAAEALDAAQPQLVFNRGGEGEA